MVIEWYNNFIKDEMILGKKRTANRSNTSEHLGLKLYFNSLCHLKWY